MIVISHYGKKNNNFYAYSDLGIEIILIFAMAFNTFGL